MEKVVNLCKRRGFVFPSAEIYGGFRSTYDYGPLGVLMLRNVKAAWWKSMVQMRTDVVGLDAAILSSPRIWEASGHLKNFTDPLVDCRKCKARWREDQLPRVTVTAQVRARWKQEGFAGADFLEEGSEVAVCEACGSPDLTEARAFNLMFKTFVGPVEDESSVAYLRPETAQGMFVNFANVLNTTRKKPPFGIAQMGKSFRNEITPGNFVFRTREFEQMELEFFVPPQDSQRWFDYWLEERMRWYVDLGIGKDRLRLRHHDPAELSHYSAGTADVEFLFPWGWGELEGIANRTDYDLKAHSAASGERLEYFDQASGERYVPHVIEPAAGSTRAMMAFLIAAYDEDEVAGERRTVLRLHPDLAPYQVAVLPLSKKETLVPVAQEVLGLLQPHFMCDYDETQSIGRRYRRQDEIGTPLAVTVDFDTLDDRAVTVRDRDTTEQARVPIDSLVKEIARRLGNRSLMGA
jgi:glycyl-tRNA synthetase